jgi:hypothetical protein
MDDARCAACRELVGPNDRVLFERSELLHVRCLLRSTARTMLGPPQDVASRPRTRFGALCSVCSGALAAPRASLCFHEGRFLHARCCRSSTLHRDQTAA